MKKVTLRKRSRVEGAGVVVRAESVDPQTHERASSEIESLSKGPAELSTTAPLTNKQNMDEESESRQTGRETNLFPWVTSPLSDISDLDVRAQTKKTTTQAYFTKYDYK